MSSRLIIPGAWYRPTTDTRKLFRKRYGRDPDEGETNRLAFAVSHAKRGLKARNETTYETAFEMLGYFLKHLALPKKELVNPGGPLEARARARVQEHLNAYHREHGSIFSKLSPAKLISAAADVVSTAAPFVKMVVGAIPVAGSLVSVAESLAKGRPLTDSFLDAVVSAAPGGAAAQMAVRTTIDIVKGKPLTEALVSEVKAQLPAGLQHAADFALAVAHGRNLQDAAIAEVKGLAANQIKALKVPLPSGVHLPAALKNGAEIGYGVLKSPTLTPAQALAVRARLAPNARRGFDHVMSMRALKHARRGSPHAPRLRPPQPSFRGATFVTREGTVTL